jgi:hypothetical protein
VLDPLPAAVSFLGRMEEAIGWAKLTRNLDSLFFGLTKSIALGQPLPL